MRVISGMARGRRLKEPPGFEIRPTSDMVKESVFNIVQFDIEGRRVLDLFAGTGQMGIEALSRGAKSAVFVDSDPEAAKLIRHNLKLCGLEDCASVQIRDALKFLERDLDKYDLVFIDPPYDTGLFHEALAEIIKFDKLNTNGIIISESKAEAHIPAVELPYFLCKEYKYGGTRILKYSRN